ncbi:MAG: hypothetical protein PF450_11905 [Bacteroidales bacterium]|jgi:pyruvate dehydrogenase complex dehydrogenase (E1) component|nr:hypothetical protein [Bacteroidales bacterium]
MNLKEYAGHLTKILKDDPKSGKLLVITSSDDEGNSFSPVSYLPTKGVYDRESQEFEANTNPAVADAICLN